MPVAQLTDTEGAAESEIAAGSVSPIEVTSSIGRTVVLLLFRNSTSSDEIVLLGILTLERGKLAPEPWNDTLTLAANSTTALSVALPRQDLQGYTTWEIHLSGWSSTAGIYVTPFQWKPRPETRNFSGGGGGGGVNYNTDITHQNSIQANFQIQATRITLTPSVDANSSHSTSGVSIS